MPHGSDVTLITYLKMLISETQTKADTKKTVALVSEDNKLAANHLAILPSYILRFCCFMFQVRNDKKYQFILKLSIAGWFFVRITVF
jgi:hypothetical protein